MARFTVNKFDDIYIFICSERRRGRGLVKVLSWITPLLLTPTRPPKLVLVVLV
jgi:hypothetical protein